MTNSKPYFWQLLNPRFPESSQNRALMKTTVRTTPTTKLGQNFQKKEFLRVLCRTKSMAQIAPTSTPKSVTANRVDSGTLSFFHLDIRLSQENRPKANTFAHAITISLLSRSTGSRVEKITGLRSILTQLRQGSRSSIGPIPKSRFRLKESYFFQKDLWKKSETLF